MSELWNEAYAAAGPSRDDMWDWLEARLRTVEAERDEARESLRIADERAGREHTNRVLAENDRDLKAELMERYVDDLAAAEARAEALEAALRTIADNVAVWVPVGDGGHEMIDGKPAIVQYVSRLDAVDIARAALAVSGNQP